MITRPSHRRSGVRNLLLMFLGLAVFGSLGTWQLNRSAERRAMLDAFESAEASLPVGGLASVPTGGDNTRVRLAGRYLADRQVLLDNMTHEGMRGYHVLTPLETAGSLVMVNRGFVAGGPDRSELPDLAVSGGEREVVGIAVPYFRRGLRLGEEAAEVSWPRRMVYPTADQLRGLFDSPLPGYQVLLDGEEPDGYVRAWRPYGMAPERHLAYAVQWYGLAAAAAGIWLAVTLRRGRKRDAN